MSRNDKRNDSNWATQAIFLPLGAISLLYGIANGSGFWQNFIQYAGIYLGVSWLMLGIMHRLLWKAKIRNQNNLDLRQTVEAALRERAAVRDQNFEENL